MADYAISNVPRRVVYANSGVGPYAFTFEILSQTDISVYRGSTLLTLTTDYSVTINTNGTGSVTLVTAGTGNITIVGAKNIQRTTDFTTGGDLFANSLNDELDNQTIFIQQVAETAERGLKAPVTDPTDIAMTLPAKDGRKGKVLAFDSTTGNPVAGPALDAMVTVIEQSAYINAVGENIDDVIAVADNEANIDTVAGVSSAVTTVATNIANVNAVGADLLEPVSEINTVATDITNVNAVGTNISNVNTVAGVSSNVTTVAGISANVTTVAGVAPNVTTVAGISGNVTTVANNSSNVTTVATNIANVNTVGGISANVTTVAGVAADVTSVAGNATDISAVAAIDSDVSTVAGIAADISTVASDAVDIAAVAADIAKVIEVANDLQETTSEIDTVANNITNVNTVGNNIADVSTVAGISADVSTVADNVTDIYNYADTYQGAKATAPSVRNDSSALQAGDLYFNTTDDQMKVYDGAAWGSVGSTVNGTSERFRYIATSGQTSFTGSDSNGNTLAYDPGFIDVYLNGVRLDQADFTASSGDTIVLTSGAATNDELNIVAYGNFELADVYTKTASDARYPLKPTGTPNGTKFLRDDNSWQAIELPPSAGVLTAVATGTLSNGDKVIINTDGTVSAVSGINSSAGTAGVYATRAFTRRATYDSTNNKVVVVYIDQNNSNYGTAVVGTVSGTDISFGTPVVFNSAYTELSGLSFSGDGKVVTSYLRDIGGGTYRGTARVGTVSGTSISFGSAVDFATGIADQSFVIYVETNKVVIAYRSSSGLGGAARVGTVSGTSISFGTEVTFYASTTAEISGVYDTANAKVVIVNTTNTSNPGYATVGTVSGTSISFGSNVAFVSGNPAQVGNSTAYDSINGKIVITYSSPGTGAGATVVGTVSGTGISFGTPTTFTTSTLETNEYATTFNTATGKVVTTYRDNANSNFGTARAATITGTSITYETPFLYLSANAQNNVSTYDSTTGKTIVVYSVPGSSPTNQGNSKVLTIGTTNLTSENYIGVSNAAYTNGQTATIQTVGSVDDAQSGLTAGQQYYVQPDGTLGLTASTPSVFAGTAVSATKLIIKG